ncbi:unnamed protein product, partial [Scytosiphon promiscuus]
ARARHAAKIRRRISRQIAPHLPLLRISRKPTRSRIGALSGGGIASDACKELPADVCK